MNFLTEKISKKEILYSILFFTAVVFGILIGFGTITSGLHMVDDHEFWRFTSYLEEGQNLKDMIAERLEGDMSWRFRPLYYPVRLIMAAVFGTNLVLMSVLKGVETVFACVVVYCIGRKLKASPGCSVIFTFLVLVGPQSAVWWKLGPQELTGTWMFGLGILFLLMGNESKKKACNLLSMVFILMACLYKESYVAMIPAVMLMILYCTLQGQAVTGRNIVSAIRKNLPWEIILAGIVLMEIYMILFVVGADKVAYISADSNTTIWFYLKTFLSNFWIHLRIGQYGAFVLLLLFFMGKELGALWAECKWQLLLACAMVVPQFILYAKSGLEERYVIPWVYGVAYFFGIVLPKTETVRKKKRLLYHTALGLLIGANFVVVFYEAWYFTYRGRGISAMFDRVCEIATEDTKVLSAFYPYDESETTCGIYLESRGVTAVYAYRNGVGTDIWKEGEGETITPDKADIILTYDEDDRHFTYEQELDFSDYELTEYNTMIMAVKKQP